MPPEPSELWRFLPLGYALSVILETPVLLIGLSRQHLISRRIFAGFWLTACTYPVVVLVLPAVIWQPLGASGYWPYVAVAELFAPAAECWLFWAAFSRHMVQPRSELLRDMLTIAFANVVSFLLGGWIVNHL